MTRLRKMMLEELERRNYSPRTIECYIPAVKDFARYFHRPPDQLGPQHIREYQAYLFPQRKLAPSSVTQRLAALRFFFIRTVKRPWTVAETPYPKKVQRPAHGAEPGGSLPAHQRRPESILPHFADDPLRHR
jgi:site-specific recombinase XerD